MIKKIGVALGALAVLLMGGATMASEFTVYVVRHAEKAVAESNPPLSVQGHTRAAMLGQMLNKAQVTKIYSTPYQRTEQTAAPLAKQLGITLENYRPNATESLVTGILTSAENSLVVGHSNTVPDIVRAFGFNVADLTEQEYGDLFVIHINDEKRSLLRLTVPVLAP